MPVTIDTIDITTADNDPAHVHPNARPERFGWKRLGAASSAAMASAQANGSKCEELAQSTWLHP